MVVRWDIAAFVVALLTMFVSASPAALSFIQNIFRSLVCLLWPSRGHCRRFLWDDVQDGLLHLCDPRGTCSHANPTDRQHDSKHCWDQTLGDVFNRAWYFMSSDSNANKFVTKKPSQLALHEDYIQTDVQTLKAYLLLTTDVSRTSEMAEQVNLLGIKRCSDLTLVHLPMRGGMPTNTKLTKFEINRMIEGYPPFFREHLTTTGGITLPFPITAADHITRGTWILSVGMTINSDPTPTLHNMQRINHEKLDVYWKGTLVLTAFNMIGRTLNQLFDYDQENYRNLLTNEIDLIAHALSCFRMIMSPEYSSQPWALKKDQIEGSKLFESVMSGCPCYHMCICPAEHTL